MTRRGELSRTDVEALDAGARRAGFSDWRVAVKRTAIHTALEAAQQMGVPVFLLNKGRYAAGVASYVPLRQASRLLEVLSREGWSDDEVARSSGLSSETVARLRRGKGSIRVAGHTYYRLVSIEGQRKDAAPLVRRRGGNDPKAALRHERAVAAGFDDWDSAVRLTLEDPAAEVARRLGVSASTVQTWRRRLWRPVTVGRYVAVAWTCGDCGQMVSDRPAHDQQHDPLASVTST